VKTRAADPGFPFHPRRGKLPRVRELRLLIFDRNYSSWSMRAGLALRLTGARFEEVAYQSPTRTPGPR
jgi:hypothetical protein